MSEEETLEDFLKTRKIDISQLEDREKDKLDIEGIEAKAIETARLQAFPFGVKDALRARYETTGAFMTSYYPTCMGI